MDAFKDFYGRTDCTVTVFAGGRGITVAPADDSDGAWMVFQKIVEEIQDQFAGDPDFDVLPHRQHVRDLPGHAHPYDTIAIIKMC